ncbi:MAG TPA: prolyl oligopeptidase family serine peptidase [Jatrophihabitans sp.]
MTGVEFPVRYAQTRRFGNGVPRGLQLAEDGSKVLFVRSAGPDDPVHALWCLDLAIGQESLVCDPRSLGDDGDIPPEERARRERARESGSGIVAYSATPDLATVCFALFGRMFVVRLGSDVVELPIAAPVVDPRIAPDGRHIAFVRDRRLWVSDLGGADTQLAGEDIETVTWGLAEHIAAEEMDRMRGYWWAPDSQHVLAARVDEADVELWHIADADNPAAPPSTVRYPVAGSANADVSLAIVRLDGAQVAVTWSREEFPYLAAVSYKQAEPLLLVQSRDQRTTEVLRVDAASGKCTAVASEHDPVWVELVPGTPDLTPDGRIVTVGADADTDTYRLRYDDEYVTPPGLQVRAVRGLTTSGVLVVASTDPAQAHVHRVGWDGTVEPITTEAGVHDCVSAGDVVATVASTMARTAPTVRVLAPTPVELESRAEEPDLAVAPVFLRGGERELVTAVLYPTGHVPGTSLPLILDPYGGPHAQRVRTTRSAFLLSQWIADQGFAVVVIDGRGTPGRGPAWDRAVHLDLASAPLADQLDGLAAVAAEHPDLDLARVGIRGWSFGGYLALLAVLRRPDVVRAAVAGAPVTEWRWYDTHYTERYLGRPEVDAAPYDRSSVLTDADGLQGELQLIHGLNDDNVIVRHSLAMSHELLVRRKLHDCLLLPGITHMASDPAVYSALLQREIDFFRRALA